MRTTVTIDPDVEALLRKAIREQGQPFKQVLNNAIRAGLRKQGPARSRPFRQRAYRLGPPMADLTKALSLAADLEDQDVIRKTASGK